MNWSNIVLAALKESGARLVAYVPDNVLAQLIREVISDNDFVPAGATREDEAIGTVTGAWRVCVARRYRRFDEGGPVLVTAKVDDRPSRVTPLRDPPFIRHRFMQGLKTSADTLDRRESFTPGNAC
jgi:hypothetical protein